MDFAINVGIKALSKFDRNKLEGIINCNKEGQRKWKKMQW